MVIKSMLILRLLICLYMIITSLSRLLSKKYGSMCCLSSLVLSIVLSVQTCLITYILCCAVCTWITNNTYKKKRSLAKAKKPEVYTSKEVYLKATGLIKE